MEQQIVGCQKLYFLLPHRFQNVNPPPLPFEVPSTRFISANYSLQVKLRLLLALKFSMASPPSRRNTRELAKCRFPPGAGAAY